MSECGAEFLSSAMGSDLLPRYLIKRRWATGVVAITLDLIIGLRFNWPCSLAGMSLGRLSFRVSFFDMGVERIATQHLACTKCTLDPFFSHGFLLVAVSIRHIPTFNWLFIFQSTEYPNDYYRFRDLAISLLVSRSCITRRLS